MENEIKKEILSRMKILKLNNQIIDDFKNNNELYVCNVGNNIEKISTANKSIVEKIEKDYNVKVYCLIQDLNILCFLYVKNNKEEWKQEKQYLRNGYAEVIYEITSNRTVGLLLDDKTGNITKVIEC